MPFVYNLSYDSSVWYQTTVNSNLTWTPASSNWGWKAVTAVALTGYVSYSASPQTCMGSNWTMYAGWTYHDPYGISHYFPGIVLSSQPPALCNPNQYGYSLSSVVAVDGSGYIMSFSAQPSASVASPNGTQITAPLSGQTTAGSLQDSNGNLISISSGSTPTFTDTLGTTALTTSGSGTPASPTVLTYTNPLAGNSSYTVHYTAYTVQTAFGCSGVVEYGAQTQNLVGSITLPDSTTYSFTYETTPGHSPNVTGRIASIILPTGGTISYSYSGGSNGITCADGTTATLKRTTPDGAWTYAHTESGSAWTTTITDPASNVTTAYFQTIYETQRTVASPALKTTNTCYNGAASPCNSTAVTLPITQVSRITTLGTSTRQSKTVAFYNSYGLPTELDEYDYGSGAPGSLTRKTVTVYNTSLGNGIVDRPSTVTVYNGGGTTIAQTTYSYDQTSVVATSGTPQHVGITGSRGNATTVSRLVAGSTTLNQTFTYFDTGNVQTATDVNSAQTTYAYGNCGNSFATTATLPLSLSRTYAWNCTGGVMTSATDENSKTTTTTFGDANYWRPTAVQDPMPATTSLA